MGSYIGPERRRHSVLVTSNTEYHMRGSHCVGVRQADGRWLDGHAAEGAMLVGLLESNGSILADDETRPHVGARLIFNTDVLTSPVRDMHRPTVTAVQRYTQAA